MHDSATLTSLYPSLNARALCRANSTENVLDTTFAEGFASLRETGA